MKQLHCATFEGIEARPVTVETTLTKGLPSFSIVGMVNTAISESKERIKSALLSNDFVFPPKRITVNLSPSDLKKEGSQFDLGIALLIALNRDETALDDWYVFGELGLDGSVKENAFFFALILSLANQSKIAQAVVPAESLPKLSKIPGVRFVGVSHLQEAVGRFREGRLDATAAEADAPDYPSIEIDGTPYFYEHFYPLDFAQVRGQEVAKRAAIISAAGMHNLLLEGSPGSGKSMIAKRLRYILPPMHRTELLDAAKLDALDGREPGFRPLRPMRSPHHSATLASVFGGGTQQARIGEVGLSHGGVLFFDELPHFAKNVLEALREPLEDYKIRISRVHSKVEYPARFVFVAAMNPCPCGNRLNPEAACRCSDPEIARYRNRLSEPFLDRIDLFVQMQPSRATDAPSVTSEQMREQVLRCHRMQKQRAQDRANGQLDDRQIEAVCRLDAETSMLLERSALRFRLSQRSIKKVLKVARTIADLAESDTIAPEHLLEAVSYRRRD